MSWNVFRASGQGEDQRRLLDAHQIFARGIQHAGLGKLQPETRGPCSWLPSTALSFCIKARNAHLPAGTSVMNPISPFFTVWRKSGACTAGCMTTRLCLQTSERRKARRRKSRFPGAAVPFSPTRYSNRLSSSGTDYHNVRVSYTDPAQGINHQGAAGSAGGKTLQAAVRVESQADAGRLAEARKRALNASRCMAVLECLGHPDLHPGITIRLTDFGAFSKTYFVDKATHKISASGGYTTAAEMHKAEGNTDDAGAGNSGGPDERF